MTDIIEVAEKCGATIEDVLYPEGMTHRVIFHTTSQIDNFTDHYRKEGAEEANKTIEELHKKLSEQQAVAAHDVEKLVGLGWTPCECDICGSTMASFKAIPKLADAIASAKQEGYEQGKEAGRDEVLDGLSTFIKWYVSEREARFVFASMDARDSFVKMMIGAEKYPSAPIDATNGDKHE